jgi:hypothetical protein
MGRAVAPRISDTSDAWEPSRHSHETSSASQSIPLTIVGPGQCGRARRKRREEPTGLPQRRAAALDCLREVPVWVGGERAKQTPRIVAAVPECVSCTWLAGRELACNMAPAWRCWCAVPALHEADRGSRLLRSGRRVSASSAAASRRLVPRRATDGRVDEASRIGEVAAPRLNLE